MNLPELMAECHRRGIRLSATADRVHWLSVAGAVDDSLRGSLAVHKAELVRLLSATCPDCHHHLDDSRRRCWRCFTRLCVGCGRNTGTPFVARCIACGDRLNHNSGGWSDCPGTQRLAA